ncbi:GH36-type glycosyl hydrolase domain-containing protein [Aquabacterium sp. OR-4]|uniref:GH36-type glycosyl hydrolase domain-containing protein n=1 Tax=Aquabacterium sp. OR-4 TaxID=2978127 RepID=UPI0028C7B69E|nr:hypothetical protein [Aquabacterium sp. OR-4]MDT7835922.1 hypothetical protein [Aquabacterium sp. OR-4]
MASIPSVTSPPPLRHLHGGGGLDITLAGHGALQRIDALGVTVNLFMAQALEAGPANLWLRHTHGGAAARAATALLGPGGVLRLQPGDDAHRADWCGHWLGLALHLRLQCVAGASSDTATWFWHLALHNSGPAPITVDLLQVQDLGLSAYAGIRLNEHYVSHYLDLAPLQHLRCGTVLAARQNLAVAGRHPWALMGALGAPWSSVDGALSYATDLRQVAGAAQRAGQLPQGVAQGLPGQRLQHEHALAALQLAPLTLAPGQAGRLGLFMRVRADHPAASGAADLAEVDAVLALPEAQAPVWAAAADPRPPAQASLFGTAALLATQALAGAELDGLFGPARRHAEHDAGGALLSFFCGPADDPCHVVLQAKEAQVLRPHGHLLRSGRHGVPDEAALTSTVWMSGVFHSMLTQGHVSINRFLSTQRGSWGQFRAGGQRVFVRESAAAPWQLLGTPSAFAIEAGRCRWLYRHAGGLIEVGAGVQHRPHALSLQLQVLQGPPLQWLVSHQVALAGDDGAVPLPIGWQWQPGAAGVVVPVPAGSELHARFAQGRFVIEPMPGTLLAEVGGDGLLHADGAPRGAPFVCLRLEASRQAGLLLRGELLAETGVPALDLPLPQLQPPGQGAAAQALAQLAEILPWYRHNALVHYLSPRGLEQFSGGGWGTRDVCQGPLEMLLALGQTAPVRDLLLRVFAAQAVDGDWPQWFMFFERERHIRAGDAHGDIVFWPLLGLARYLLASGDAGLLDTPVAYHASDASTAETGTVWQHVQRALAVIAGRRIQGTALAAYGHGDWNDSLQPADPALREHLCSAWTVTLHHQTLGTLARALQALGRADEARAFATEAAAVRADFQRLLLIDGVVAGYVLFTPGQAPQPLLHPADALTGVQASLLPMMHAMLEDMLSADQARAHLARVEAQLSGPDGARLFDRPMPYRGGPEQLFQRAESSAFFGREIGVMYTHAHLRWAEALAHLGEARRFWAALALIHPIDLPARLPQATRRQANCYYSSSDAAFADRYEAQRDYPRIARGEVALDGGWRVYSSGPGIAIGLVIGHLLGVRREAATLVFDPVLPPELDGLRARLPLLDGIEVEIVYRVGPLGHGPLAITLDGQPLAFVRGANPYRTGAAEVAVHTLRGALAGGARQLGITLG